MASVFAVGVALAPTTAAWELRVLWGLAGGALLAAAALAGAGHRRALIVAGVVALGIARGAAGAAHAPPGARADDRVVDRVEGVVRGPVVSTPHGVGAVVTTAGDPVWVWSEVALEPGERIVASGFLRTPRGFIGPGQPDQPSQLLARGARYTLSARTLERIADDPQLADRAWRSAGATQQRWSRAIDAAGGDAAARAALAGIVVGDRAAVPPALDDRWRAAGIFHVLSVSGLHLAVIAGLAFLLLRRLVAASPLGGRVHPGRLAAPAALVIAITYTMITGAQIATVRALVVVAFVFAGAALDRPLRLVDALGAAALAILAVAPAQLADPGFQLSFVAGLALATAPRADVPITSPSRPRRVLRWIARGVAASLWVALATAPITAYHFQIVTGGGVLGNLVLAPALELVALPLALGGLALGWGVPIRIATTVVHVVDRVAGWMVPITPVGHVALASPRLALALVGLALVLGARRRRTRVELAGWLLLCLGWALGRTPPPARALRVTFLDVGQGDAAIIELPDGQVWLVDAGGAPNAGSLVAATVTGRAVSRTLAVYGHDHVDVAVISHPHPDHYLGLLALDVPVRELWAADERTAEDHAGPRDPALPSRRVNALPGFAQVAQLLVARGTILVHPPLGIARVAGGVELVVLAPRLEPGGREHTDPVRTVNDNSLVIELRYRGRAILFTGDLEAEGEATLVTSGLGAVDVVKVPHHGSPTSSTALLVTTTHPALAVISCGVANQFGFPALAVVARWQAAGAEVARTDVTGAITVVVDDRGALAVDRFAAPPP